MAKSDLGTKRICPTTGKKFYDLNKNPVISPYTGEVVPIAPVAPPRAARGDAARAAAAASAAADTPEPAEAEELVSLEEADADPVHRPRKFADPLNFGAQRPHDLGGVEDVFALKQARNPGFADC